MRLDVILRVTTKLLLPFILLFGLYVHFHGDFGPGGGFQAGVIAAVEVHVKPEQQNERKQELGGDPE
ncbi:MAG: MnhB domain-containing protein, partial [Pseudomonadota bacterium]